MALFFASLGWSSRPSLGQICDLCPRDGNGSLGGDDTSLHDKHNLAGGFADDFAELEFRKTVGYPGEAVDCLILLLQKNWNGGGELKFVDPEVAEAPNLAGWGS